MAQEQYVPSDSEQRVPLTDSTEPTPPPQSSPALEQPIPVKRPPWIVIGLVVYAVVLYGTTGYFYFRNHKKDKLQIVEPQETPTQAVTQTTTTIVPLVLVPLTDPENPPSATISGTTTIPFFLPFTDREQFAAYKLDTLQVIGPKDWLSDGQYTDNDVNIFLYTKWPYEYPNASVWVYEAKQGTPDALITAGQYFGAVRTNWNMFNTSQPLPELDSRFSFTETTPHLIQYAAPLNNGFEIHIAIFSNAASHIEDKQWYTIKIETIVPVEYHQLGVDIVDAFIKQHDLTRK